MTTKTLARWVLGPLVAIAACTSAADVQGQSCTPRFEQGWVRMGPAAMPMMAGFGRLRNACPAAVVVVSASSPQFADVSLHQTRTEAGISRMRPVQRLQVAPGKSAVLEPGGLHLMLMQPRATLVEGATVRVVLTLDDGRQVEADLAVRKTAPAAAPPL